MTSKASLLVQIQSKLHKGDSLAVPCSLLLLATLLLFYVIWGSPNESAAVQVFYDIILILPLAFLEKKLVASADALRDVSRISETLLVSHCCVLLAGAPVHCAMSGFFSFYSLYGFTAFGAVCFAFTQALGTRSASSLIKENKDVWKICFLSIFFAVAQEGIRLGITYAIANPFGLSLTPSLGRVWIGLAGNLEIMVFVPAIMMVRRGSPTVSVTSQEVDTDQMRRGATVSMAFLLLYYFVDDLMMVGLSVLPVASSLAHLAHFVMVLDFAGFVLAHYLDPAKLSKCTRALRDIFEDMCAV